LEINVELKVMSNACKIKTEGGIVYDIKK